MLDRIRAAMAALPPAEQRVAGLLLADAPAFAALPVGEIARRSAVSKPTVVRFCRSVGYGGLADFKLKLAGCVGHGPPLARRAIDVDDGPDDLLVKIVDNAVVALLDYRHAAAGHAIERAIHALARAALAGQRIDFYGVGGSAIVAHDAQHKFFRLGIVTQAVSDAHVQAMNASMLRRGDCAAVISHSGRSRDLVQVADIAQRRGATVVAITASGSPLAHRAQRPGQVLLAVDHPAGEDGCRPTASRLLHHVIIDIVATGVALRLQARRLQPMLPELGRNLRARRYEDGATPGGDSDNRPSTP